MKKAFLIAVGGRSGTGKSTLATGLVRAFSDAVHFDSDIIRKELAGVSPTTRLPAEAYAWGPTKRMIAEMQRRTSKALKEGKTVILTATFLANGGPEEQQKIAENAGADFAGILLEADTPLLLDRVARRVDDASDATPSIVERQSKQKVTFPSTWTRIDATQPREEVLARVLKVVGRPGKYSDLR